MSDAEDPIPKSDLPTRFAAGVLMIGVALAATVFGGWAFRALVAAAAAVMIIEWSDMKGVGRRWAYASAAVLVVALMIAIEYYFPNAAPSLDDESVLVIDAEDFLMALWGLGALAVLGIVVGAASRRVSLGWGFFYVGAPAFALLVVNWAYAPLVLWVFTVTWATDILAYAAGRSIGGPKLAPRISPNKTWAGLFGGVAGAAAFGWLVAWYFALGAPFLWIGAAMGLAAQLGDLYESWEKRRAGVKDSGALLPGHGGVLDRLDGLLAVALLTLAILCADLWQPPVTDEIESPDTVTVMRAAAGQAG